MAGLLVALVWPSAAAAQPLVPPGIYKLTDQALVQRGCFPPCRCALASGTPRGTLRLRYTGYNGLYDTYAVTDVNFIAPLDTAELRIIGSGTYQVGGQFALVQRLQLDLRTGADPPVHFDSGTVPFAGGGGLDVQVSANGLVCYDTVIQVAARPVPPEQVRRYTLGTTSEYQEGCWGPCACALYDPQPVGGVFDLVELQAGPLFVEYSVSGIDWQIVGGSPSAGSDHVTGVGIYVIGGEVALQQRLTALLAFGGGDPLALDSGMVGGADFPAIDLTITMNNFFCFDQVFYLHTQPFVPARGDLNCDGLVNNGDIDAFILALTDPAAFAAAYPGCDTNPADPNGDGVINNADVDTFVALLTSGGM
jgi:hypothetical protein